MSAERSRSYTRRYALEGKNLAIIGVVAVNFLLLVVTAAVSLRTLESVRGYVMGEGHWSKAQKRATLALHTYARTGDEVFLDAFDSAIAVTLGDRQARVEMERRRPDEARVREGFRRGRIPDDAIGGMIWLVRTFGETDEIGRALSIWRQGDRQIDNLIALQDRLRTAVETGGAGSPSTGEVLREIEEVDGRLTELEDAFTWSLHQTADRAEGVLRWILAGVTLLFALSALLGGSHVYRQLRASELAARRSEARYRGLFEQAVVGVAVVTRAGTILEANPAFARLFGFEDPDELCRTWGVEDLYAAPGERKGVLEHLSIHGSLLTRNLEVRHRDGSTGWAVVGSVLMTDPETGEERILTSAANITEQKALERQLLAVRRMEAMGQLAGGVAHDFNNLLTAIHANAELLAMDLEGGGGAAADEAVAEILTATRSAAGLTAQLLEFSRGQAPDVVALDVNARIRAIGGMLTRLLPESIHFRMRLADAGLAAEVSASRLEQLVMNLTINARDAMPAGGDLELATEHVSLHGAAAQRLGLLPGSYVRISVADTGVGMTPEVQARVFEPFFTTRAQEGGSGMGLSTVYGIVVQSGGTIDVVSAPGQGSTFSIYLPRSGKLVESGGEERDEADLTARPGAGVRILLVEDEDAVRHVARRILSRAGFEVVDAPRAEDALRLLDEIEPVDLVVTDVVMPGLSGPGLIADVRKRHGDIPVLYVSGYLDQALSAEELSRPDTDFLGKPFRPQDLLRALTRLRDRPGS